MRIPRSPPPSAPACKAITPGWVRHLPSLTFDNLIGNAWTFTSRRSQPQIEVAIRDNGPGFAADDAQRLFTPFQRLHHDFPGTGIGLATVQRIAARHGGSVRVEAKPGVGATFILTLPAA